MNYLKKNDLNYFFWVLYLAFSGAVWVPILKFGGFIFELPNLASIVMILTFPILLFKRNFKIYLPRYLVLIMVSVLYVHLGLVLHGKGGVNNTLMSIISIFSIMSLINFEIYSEDKVKRILVHSFFVFLVIIEISALWADIDLVTAVFNYMVSFDRREFVFGFLRTLFNSFSVDSDVEYLASAMNLMAAAFAMFYLLSISFMLSAKRDVYVVVVFISSLFFSLLLFSSSSILAMVASTIVLFVSNMIRNKRYYYIFYVLILVFIVLVFFGDYISSYMRLNIEEDSSSRGDRMNQYAYAIDYIESNLFFGFGFLVVDGHVIHNYPLFSWVSSGLLGFFLSLLVVFGAVYIVISGVIQLVAKKGSPVLASMQITLPFLFIVRILVAGAGGVPVGNAMICIALAILAKKLNKSVCKGK